MHHWSTPIELIGYQDCYLQSIPEFPQRGGANGSVRFYPEISHAANAGICMCCYCTRLALLAAPICVTATGIACASLQLQFKIWAAGLPVAVELLKDVADKYDGVSYADLFQMASAQAIEVGAAICNFSHKHPADASS